MENYKDLPLVSMDKYLVVAAVVDLPSNPVDGQARYVLADGLVYIAKSGVWSQLVGGITPTMVSNSSSIDLTVALGVLSATVVDSYIKTLMAPYSVAASWSGVGPYTMAITAVAHGKGLNPIVTVRETLGGVSSNVIVDDISVTDITGDVTITSLNNFVGKVIIS